MVGRLVFAPPFSLQFEADAQSTTQSDGSYAITGFTPMTNTRYLIIAGGGAFEQVLHPDQPCHFGCVFSTGSPSMFLPASGVHFLTAPAGSIRGRVTRSDTGAPISLLVSLRRAAALGDVGLVQSDADGEFLIQGLAVEDYWVEVGVGNAPPDLTGQLFPGIDLDITRTVFTVANSGMQAPLRVNAGSASVANFALNRGGCLSGQRVSALDGSAVQARVFLKRTDPLSHPTYADSFTSSFGGIFTIDRLVPGTVKASFGFNDRFQPNFHPDQLNESSSTSLAVVAGTCTHNVNATLIPRQVVRGTVREMGTGLPVPGVEVRYGGSSSLLASTTSNQAGEFIIQGIDPQVSAWLTTSDLRQYFAQAFALLPPLAPFNSWTRFDVAADQSIAGMDFALHSGAFVSGTVTGRIEANYDTTVEVLDEAGVRVGFARPPGAQGAYATKPFAPGSYRLAVKPGLGSHRYAYPGVSCRGTGPGTGIPLCAVPGAQLISFSATGEHPGYHFDVDAIDTLLRNGFE